MVSSCLASSNDKAYSVYANGNNGIKKRFWYFLFFDNFYLFLKGLTFPAATLRSNQPSDILCYLSRTWNWRRHTFWTVNRTLIMEASSMRSKLWSHLSTIDPMSIDQCEARNTKHSDQTFFKIIFCCALAKWRKCSLFLACLMQVIRIWAKIWCCKPSMGCATWLYTAVGGTSSSCWGESSFRSRDLLCFLGPRSSWTAALNNVKSMEFPETLSQKFSC